MLLSDTKKSENKKIKFLPFALIETEKQQEKHKKDRTRRREKNTR